MNSKKLFPALIIICLSIPLFALLFKVILSSNHYTSVLHTAPSLLPESTTPHLTNSLTLSDDSTQKVVPELTSVDDIFTKATYQFTPSAGVVTLLSTGDVLTARTVNYKMTQFNNFTWPFEKTKELTNAADIAFINLETPLIAGCPVKNDGMLFCGNLKSTEGLLHAGIDVVNLANNHASNQGPEGVTETEQALKNAGFLVAGIDGNNATFQTVKGTRFAFLGYNEVNDQPGVTHADDATIMREVAATRTQADVVVVQFHWGNEYTYSPSENQKRLARVTIDAGADIIIGNHPHWFQGLEFYKNKLIMYSHGNFVFDQMWSRETREGIVGEYQFAGNKLIGVRFTPILIEDFGQPRILEGEESQKILNTLERVSRQLLVE